MNYYIDFDNTLYNTPLLLQKMMKTIYDCIDNMEESDKDKLYNSKTIDDINHIINDFSKKYGVNNNNIIHEVHNVISNGSSMVFPDSIPFIENLQKNNNLFLLSYANNNLKYQTAKILGSNLLQYFDGTYITCKPKYDLDIDYSNGIFIDDNPRDLEGLYSKNPIKLIRLRRKENKYSSIDLSFKIEEYTKFDEIKI